MDKQLMCLKYASLKDAKVFSIEDDAVFLLEKTENKTNLDKQPFPNTFIELRHKIDTHQIIGITISEKNNVLAFDIITVYCEEKQEDGGIDVFSFPLTYHSEDQEKMDKAADSLSQKDKQELDFLISKNTFSEFNIFRKKYGNQVRELINNFLDFLNTPDVELVEVLRTDEQNLKRIQRGQQSIPSHTYIKLNGKLKVYLNKLKSDAVNKISHKFWVRGHFRTLRNETRYGSNTGKKIWILPHIRGEGILIERSYLVKA